MQISSPGITATYRFVLEYAVIRYVHQLWSEGAPVVLEARKAVTSRRIGALKENGPGVVATSGSLDGGTMKPLPGSPSAVMAVAASATEAQLPRRIAISNAAAKEPHRPRNGMTNSSPMGTRRATRRRHGPPRAGATKRIAIGMAAPSRAAQTATRAKNHEPPCKNGKSAGTASSRVDGRSRASVGEMDQQSPCR